MDNMILEFLEAYKNLDELCKQILSSDNGISEYIDEMRKDTNGAMLVHCWEEDYKKLKYLRWLRNQLVHAPNSFQENLVKEEDIDWLRNFYSRIINCTDPFSILYELRKQKTLRRKGNIGNNAKIKNVPQQSYTGNCDKKTELYGRWGLAVGFTLLIGIIIVILFL